MAQVMVASAAHSMPPFPLPALPRVRPPAIPKGTPGPNTIPAPQDLPLTNRIWADGQLQHPSSASARHRKAIVSKRLEKALKHGVLGMNIYAYRHIQTGQVVYSLTNNMDNNKIMKQLIFHGKKTVPAALRRDVWRPYFQVRLPRTDAGAAKGMGIYQDLLEMSRWRQFDPPREMKVIKADEIPTYENVRPSKVVGAIAPQPTIARRLMYQERHAVADLSAVLTRWNRLMVPKSPKSKEERMAIKSGEKEQEYIPAWTPREKMQKSKEKREREMQHMSERKRHFEAEKEKSYAAREAAIKQRQSLLYAYPGSAPIDKHALARISTEYDASLEFRTLSSAPKSIGTFEPTLELLETIADATREEDRYLVELETKLKEREQQEEELYKSVMSLVPDTDAKIAQLPDAERKQIEDDMEAEIAQKTSELELEANKRRDVLTERKERIKADMIARLKVASGIQNDEGVSKLRVKSRDIDAINAIDFKELKDNKKLVKKLSEHALQLTRPYIQELNQIHLDQRYEAEWWQKQSRADSMKLVGPYAHIGEEYRKRLTELREKYQPEIDELKALVKAQKKTWENQENHAVEVCFANIQDAYHAVSWPKHVTFGELDNKAVVLQKTKQIREHEHYDEDEQYISEQAVVKDVVRGNSVHVFGAARFPPEPQGHEEDPRRYKNPAELAKEASRARESRIEDWERTVSILTRDEIVELRQKSAEVQAQFSDRSIDAVLEPNIAEAWQLSNAAFERFKRMQDPAPRMQDLATSVSNYQYDLQDIEAILQGADELLPYARTEALLSGDLATSSRVTWLEYQFKILKLMKQNPQAHKDADLREQYWQKINERASLLLRLEEEGQSESELLTKFDKRYPYIRDAARRLELASVDSEKNRTVLTPIEEGVDGSSAAINDQDVTSDVRDIENNTLSSAEGQRTPYQTWRNSMSTAESRILSLSVKLKKDSEAWLAFKKDEERMNVGSTMPEVSKTEKREAQHLRKAKKKKSEAEQKKTWWEKITGR